MRCWIVLASLLLLATPVAGQDQAQQKPPQGPPQQRPPGGPLIDAGGGGAAPQAPTGAGPAGSAAGGGVTGGAGYQLTSPLYSVMWATSEIPWFPVGLILAAALGYYVGSRKGPSPWEE